MNKQGAILRFFQAFDKLNIEVPNFESLLNGIGIVALFQYLHDDHIDISVIQEAVKKNDWFSRLKQIRAVSTNLTKILGDSKTIDTTAIVRRGDISQLESLLSMLINYSVISPKKEEVQQIFQKLSPEDQAILKEIIEPSKSETTRQEVPNLSPVKTSQNQSNTNNLKDQIQKKKKELETLKAKNKLLKEEQSELYKNQNEETDESMISKIAELKAEIFALEVKNKTKTQMLQSNNTESQINQLQIELNTIQNEVESLGKELKTHSNESLLMAKLNTLKTNPNYKIGNEINESMKDLKRNIRKLHRQNDLLQTMIDEKQRIVVLEQRKQFLNQMLASNTMRLNRAKLHLYMVQKKMRTDVFLADMNSFV
ncbi:hypothetical protein GPJ56_003880 [Histomonas meleagridis]|uniref:uncharacterized protein n=1 Tax=Histomonas meleagridis TaxID=135588 RepID=UPI003559418C|nr:hypothetical protein GPJ56_003880 [Histomonas meleagridis]KAH0805339.1 hypothetical protein GO595_002284 [Histomonas meleagridis]